MSGSEIPLAKINSARLNPKREAMAASESPRCTTYDVGRVVVGAVVLTAGADDVVVAVGGVRGLLLEQPMSITDAVLNNNRLQNGVDTNGLQTTVRLHPPGRGT